MKCYFIIENGGGRRNGVRVSFDCEGNPDEMTDEMRMVISNVLNVLKQSELDNPSSAVEINDEVAALNT